MEKEHRSRTSLLGNWGRSEVSRNPKKTFPLLLVQPPLSAVNLPFSEEEAMAMGMERKGKDRRRTEPRSRFSLGGAWFAESTVYRKPGVGSENNGSH
jgi:hypothetical protein